MRAPWMNGHGRLRFAFARGGDEDSEEKNPSLLLLKCGNERTKILNKLEISDETRQELTDTINKIEE